MQVNKRFWEIDFLRGLAIVMMIIFHLLLDINFFYKTNIVLFSGFWGFFQKVTASIFLCLVGLSLSISNVQKNASFNKYIIRGSFIFAIAMGLTLITYIASPWCYIKFGVLHFTGVAIILVYFFRNFRHWNVLVGIICIALGYKLNNYVMSNDYWFIIGLISENFSSADYFPIFPWLGVVLIGLFIGEKFYTAGKRNFSFMRDPKNIVTRLFCFMGKNSLLIYLLHQVVLCGLLGIIRLISTGKIPLL